METGHDGTTVAIVETEYAPCACSPLGKLWRTSRPHAPGAPAAWTTYYFLTDGAFPVVYRREEPYDLLLL